MSRIHRESIRLWGVTCLCLLPFCRFLLPAQLVSSLAQIALPTSQTLASCSISTAVWSVYIHSCMERYKLWGNFNGCCIPNACFLLPLQVSRNTLQITYTGMSIFNSDLYVNKDNIIPCLADRISWMWDVLQQVFRLHLFKQ